MRIGVPHAILAALILLAVCAGFSDQRPPLEKSLQAGYQFNLKSDNATPEIAPDAVHIIYWEKWNNFEGEAMQHCVNAFNAHSREALTSSDTKFRARFLSPSGQQIFVHLLSVTQVNQKTLLAVSGGIPPDVAGLWSRDVPNFARFNAALPLEDWLKRDGPAREEYQPPFWNMCVYDGKVFALPTTPATVALHWNKKLFREAGLDPETPPRTIQELDAFNEKLTKLDADGKITQMGFHPGEPGWWNYGWGNWFGGPHVSSDGRTLLLDSKEWLAAFNWLNGVAEKYGRDQVRSFRGGLGNFDSPQNAFISGKVAMVLQGVWMANFIRMYNPALEWGAAPFPMPGGTAKDPVTLVQADVLIVPRGAAHPEEAWKFVRYVSSLGALDDPDAPLEGIEILCFYQGKNTPFRKVSRAFSQKFQRQYENEYIKVFMRLGESKNAQIEPVMPMWGEIRQAVASAYDELMDKGNQPGHNPQEILSNLQNRLQPKLDREWARIDRERAAEEKP